MKSYILYLFIDDNRSHLFGYTLCVFSSLIPNKKDCILNICSQHSDINDSNIVNSSACFAFLISSFLTRNQNGL